MPQEHPKGWPREIAPAESEAQRLSLAVKPGTTGSIEIPDDVRAVLEARLSA